ncbi:MAG: VacJ family lipoprotein [Rickettsiaceae bacterium]
MLLKSITKVTIIIATMILSLSSNAIASKAEDKTYDYDYAALNNRCQVYDPYESVNRKVFIFNGVLDTFILRPIAKGYGRFTNDYTKNRVDSFLNNIREPLSIVNYGIQGKAEGSLKTFWRFAINSTLGLAGIFDVATKFGLTAEPQTFGNTLAHYGVGSGPYIVLPFFGGTNSRDLMDTLALNSALNPVMYPMHSDFKNVLTVTRIIHSRDKIMPFTDYVSKNSPDSYIAIRDAILNERESKMVYPKDFVCPRVNK